MKKLVLMTVLVVANAVNAAPFESSSGYTIDLPAGWTTTSKPDAAVVQLNHDGEGLAVKLKVDTKPTPLGAAEVERSRAADEASLKKHGAAYKSVPVEGPQIAGAPATHYGFVYRDPAGQVVVSRFAVFGRSRAADHQWAKLNAVFPRARIATASPALDKLLAGFRWKAETTTAVVTPASAPPKPPPDAVAVTVTHAPAPPPPKSEGSGGFGLQMNDMSAEDTKAMQQSVTGAISARTEEEKAQARQRTFGNTFNGGAGGNQ